MLNQNTISEVITFDDIQKIIDNGLESNNMYKEHLKKMFLV